MKKAYIGCLLAVLFIKFTWAQNARVNVAIVNSPVFTTRTDIVNTLTQFDGSNNSIYLISFDKEHKGTCNITIAGPQAVGFSSYFSSIKNKPANKFFWFSLFLTPGDDITITIDPNKAHHNFVVTGRGSINNQPELLELTGKKTDEFKKDTIPNRVIAAINKQSVRNRSILNRYALQFNQSDIVQSKPSKAFMKNAWFDQEYFVARFYYAFNHDNNFFKSEESLRKWQKVEDSVLRTIKLSNDAALGTYNYQQLIVNFLIREKERLWTQQQTHPELFYRDWYGTTDTAKGKKLFRGEASSLLVEKIINKYFTGKTAEYLHHVLIDMNLRQSNHENIAVLFAHFKQRYPNSKYIAQFSGPINDIVKKQGESTLTDKMVFVANNGTKLNTLNDVLALTKGKTVLVDMWGTWCSPCRESIEQHSAALEAYFKDKGVNFLYIANNDLTHEKEWKRLIAYYHMEGMHILANEKLDKDIMDKVKSNGYPTYFIIKKDGSYKLTKTQYPINRQAMINELLAASK